MLTLKLIEQVLFVIKNISFKNRAEAPENPPLELQIVQDADRLGCDLVQLGLQEHSILVDLKII